MGYISPLFDSLFSVATPGKESRQLAPYNHSTRTNSTTVQDDCRSFYICACHSFAFSFAKSTFVVIIIIIYVVQIT